MGGDLAWPKTTLAPTRVATTMQSGSRFRSKRTS
jgi:hypothetical protein